MQASSPRARLSSSLETSTTAATIAGTGIGKHRWGRRRDSIPIRIRLRTATVLCLVLLAGCTAAPPGEPAPDVQTQSSDVPRYQVDASWPKDLPNNWILWNGTGLQVDAEDHIWVVNRPRQVSMADAGAAQTPPISECCIPAPSLVEFDSEGNLLSSWGGPEFVPDWPILEHGLVIDAAGNFWIGGNFRAGATDRLLTAPIPRPAELRSDRHVLKFSPEHEILLTIGRPSNDPVNNQDTTLLGGPSDMWVDDEANEVYIADGYMNRRVVVYDSNTGEFKRGWGAYGIPLSEIENGPLPAYDPAEPTRQFRGPVMNVQISVDGLVYVGDRSGKRVQVFTKEGEFVEEFLVHPETLGIGSVWSTAFSTDPEQRYLFVADGTNGKIRILNREDGTEVGSFGRRGHQAGQFDQIENMAFDSQGNLYITEVAPNTRIQKFVPVP